MEAEEKLHLITSAPSVSIPPCISMREANIFRHKKNFFLKGTYHVSFVIISSGLIDELELCSLHTIDIGKRK